MATRISENWSPSPAGKELARNLELDVSAVLANFPDVQTYPTAPHFNIEATAMETDP